MAAQQRSRYVWMAQCSHGYGRAPLRTEIRVRRPPDFRVSERLLGTWPSPFSVMQRDPSGEPRSHPRVLGANAERMKEATGAFINDYTVLNGAPCYPRSKRVTGDYGGIHADHRLALP